MDANRQIAAVRSSLAILGALAPAWAAACSASADVFASTNNGGWLLFAIATLLTAAGVTAALRNHAPRRAIVSLLLLLFLNPGWWWSAFWGDCGTPRLAGGLGFTALSGMILASPLLAPTGSRWSIGRSLALAMLTGVAFAVLWPDLPWGDGLIPAMIVAPPILACGVALTEFLLGDSLAGTLARWDDLDAWKRRIVYVAAGPLAVCALLVILQVVGYVRWFVVSIPNLLEYGVMGWMAD